MILCGMMVPIFAVALLPASGRAVEIEDFLLDGFSEIVIDPGHGGADHGAAGIEGLEEKDFTLRLALLVEREIERRIKKVHVYLTRRSDVNMSLPERTAFANNKRADLFISIHAGAAPSRSVVGRAWCYYLEGGSEQEEILPGPEARRWDLAYLLHANESRLFAKLLERRIKHPFRCRAVGIRGGAVAVLQGALMPAVLMEIGCITSPGDEALMKTDALLARLAADIASAVADFKKEVEFIP